MSDSLAKIPVPTNEPVRSYAPGSPERDSLKSMLKSMSTEKREIGCSIGGKEVHTRDIKNVVMPHSHREVVAEFSLGGKTELLAAFAAAESAKPDWEHLHWRERAAIFLRAADLLAGPFRDRMNAATMLGQSKSVYQAEIDSACEMADFFRFNAYFYQQILEQQPLCSPGVINQSEYRPLEGPVVAITPFNFSAIAANLCAAPAMVGNTVVWKPSDTQMLSAAVISDVFKAAGLPDGVINRVAADGPLTSEVLIKQRNLGGVHFTGSTATFQSIYRMVGDNVAQYRSYPRLVGETGGKDFIFAEASADPSALVAALIRGAFEYQGQKCSAASRAYIPKSLWQKIKSPLVEQTASIKMGDVRDFRNFMNAVIDERSFKKISGYIDFIKKSNDAEIIFGGGAKMDVGYFIEPTIVVTTDPKFKTMQEEIFGPILTIFVYDESRFEQTLSICDETSPYALTGAIFSHSRYAIEIMSDRLRHAAGNLYINDKPTGAVVGQQPFGGARASGTNDKSGSALNLYRWLSARTIKEPLVPVRDYRYAFMSAE